MAFKIRKAHFNGTSKVFTRDKDGLASILRKLAADNANTRVKAAIAASDFDLDELDVTDNSTGTASGDRLADIRVPKGSHTATGSTGVQIAAFGTAYGTVVNALSVLVQRVSNLRGVIGLESASYAGTVATPGTVAAVTKAITAASGTGAASAASVEYAAERIKDNIKFAAKYLSDTAEVIGFDALGSDLVSELNENQVVGVSAVSAAGAGGAGAALKTEVDAFFSSTANAVATLAAYLDKVATDYNPDKANITA